MTYADDTVAPYFNPPIKQITSTCDSGSCSDGKQTQVQYIYDDYGNLTTEFNYGDLKISSDNLTVSRTYEVNTSNWIVGLLASEIISRGIGTINKVSQRRFYYDDQGGCTTTSNHQIIPSKGNLTTVIDWLSGSNNPESRFGYDEFGNIVCAKDLTCTRKITPKRWRESTKIKIGDSSNEKDFYGRADCRHSAWI